MRCDTCLGRGHLWRDYNDVVCKACDGTGRRQFGMSEEQAINIFVTAINEHRASDLMHCLFTGGSATVDPEGNLVLASNDVIAQLMGTVEKWETQ